MFRRCLALSLLALSALGAYPKGFHPVAGTVYPPTYDPVNKVFILSSEDRAVVNWDSFSIAADELVYFEQSGTNMAVLNRVIGSDVSNLLGRFGSNGAI